MRSQKVGNAWKRNINNMAAEREASSSRGNLEDFGYHLGGATSSSAQVKIDVIINNPSVKLFP